MKKITLNETDLAKIVNKVLNEQKDKEFDEDEINFLYWIFERELKPPFRRGEIDSAGDYKYFNRDGVHIGWLYSYNDFVLFYDPFLPNIKYKVCSAFGFAHNTTDWWRAIHPHLKSWLESQLNIKLRYLHPL